MDSTSGKPLLLHVCCAPCASGCLDRLSGRKVTLFYSNSNIDTAEEFEKRLSFVKRLAGLYSLELIADNYSHEAWRKAVSVVPGYENCPERGARCRACFAYSLGRAAAKAAELGMDFTTTLTVSPHKDSETIFSVCSENARFEPWNFKKQDGFAISLRKSRELGLYRQNYCGCEYSHRT